MVAAGCGNNSPENEQLLAKSGDGVLDRHMSASTEPRPAAAHLLGWDCIEFWVGNARTTAGFLTAAFGFRCTAYAGPETGMRTKASYVLEQGDIRFVVSGALSADSPIAEHVRTHGDGVHDLAWLVDDASAAHAAAVGRGAQQRARTVDRVRRTR